MTDQAIQDMYTDWAAQCYGCGRLNPHGLHIKSYWDGDETVCRFNPKPYHTATSGFVYGGLIASLIDCHSTATAAAAGYRHAGAEPKSRPELRYVTASLQVDFLRPTPMDQPLEIRGVVEEIGDRKVVVVTSLYANGEICAKGRVVAVKAPKSMINTSPSKQP